VGNGYTGRNSTWKQRLDRSGTWGSLSDCSFVGGLVHEVKTPAPLANRVGINIQAGRNHLAQLADPSPGAKACAVLRRQASESVQSLEVSIVRKPGDGVCQDVVNSDLVEIAKRNSDFRRNYGLCIRAFLYLRSINAARPRWSWWQTLTACIAATLSLSWRWRAPALMPKESGQSGARYASENKQGKKGGDGFSAQLRGGTFSKRVSLAPYLLER